MATYAERLEEVQQAISDVVSHGQSHNVTGRVLTRADLPELLKLENWLEGKIARGARGGIRTAQAVPRG